MGSFGPWRSVVLPRLCLHWFSLLFASNLVCTLMHPIWLRFYGATERKLNMLIQICMMKIKFQIRRRSKVLLMLMLMSERKGNYIWVRSWRITAWELVVERRSCSFLCMDMFFCSLETMVPSLSLSPNYLSALLLSLQNLSLLMVEDSTYKEMNHVIRA